MYCHKEFGRELGEDLEGILGSEEIATGPNLTEGQWEQLNQIVKDFADVFSKIPGRMRDVVHKIMTPEEAIVRERWREIPHYCCQLVKEELRKMLKQGIMTISRSPWRSPIVTVPKKDGTLCSCMDFHKLNAITQVDAFPMPQVGELPERIRQAGFISTFFLAKRYWQIPSRLQYQAKMAFETP